MLNLKIGAGKLETSNKLVLWITISPIVISLLLGAVVLLATGSLPSTLPLFYSLPWGNDQLVSHQELLLVPAIIAVIILCNALISWQLHPSQLFFKRILLFSPLVISLLLIITFIKIVLNFI